MFGLLLGLKNLDTWPFPDPVVLQYRFRPLDRQGRTPLLDDEAFDSHERFQVEFRARRPGSLRAYAWDRAQSRLVEACPGEICRNFATNQIFAIPGSGFVTDDVPGPESLYVVFGSELYEPFLPGLPGGSETDAVQSLKERSGACETGIAEQSRDRGWMELRSDCDSAVFARLTIQHK